MHTNVLNGENQGSKDSSKFLKRFKLGKTKKKFTRDVILYSYNFHI